MSNSASNSSKFTINITIMNIVSLFMFLRKSATNGLVYSIAQFSKKRTLYFISFIIAPFATIGFYCKRKKPNIAKTIENLGPIFIKFGQTISTRPDLIGNEFAHSLSNLRDKLDPFPSKIAIEIVEKEFGKKIDEIFSYFSKESVAAASIAQVHKAELKDGSKVAVKILRPEIKKLYKRDISLLYMFAKIGNIIFKQNKRLKLFEIVKLFEKSMRFELNLKNEAAACSELYDNFEFDNNIVIPKVYWDYCTTQIFVMGWIDGISIYDSSLLETYNLDKKDIVKKLATCFLNQAYRDGYFHADLHPGNIFVQKDGRIALVDFGIVGRLEERDRIAIAEILHGFINRDYKKVAEVHIFAGYVEQDTNLMEFALACRMIAEPIVGKPANQISIGKLLENLFEITTEYGMEIQPRLLLLQKTMAVLEGISQTLDPKVNMWDLVRPWIQNWATKNITLDAKLFRLLKLFIKDLKTKL